MAHNRAQLNDLIFHNRTVLPLTSPGYAEMTLAVAELQGGNNTKAAMYAEAAVARDVTLAAGWLGKLAADVFEATPDDLRKDRALFCIDRALECAPTCRREIIEFFVANILGHYVEVLCAGALAELAQWVALEACADELEREALELDWQALQRRGGAALLEAAGLVSGMVALFSRRLSTQVFSGAASVAAFSEAAHLTRETALLEGMASELRTVEYALRLEGHEHRRASLLYLLPARDLVGMAARLLHVEGLATRPLDRLIQALTSSLRTVLNSHLQRINRELFLPMSAAIRDDAQSLAATYERVSEPTSGGLPYGSDSWTALIERRRKPSTLTKAQAHGLYAGPHPLSQETARWLEQMLPGVQNSEAYQLLSRPLPTIARQIYGFDTGTRFRSLPDRMRDADRNLLGQKILLGLLTLVCLGVPPVLLLPGALIWRCVRVCRQRRQAREQVHETFGSLWSADTWIKGPVTHLNNRHVVTATTGRQSPPPLPTWIAGGTPTVVPTLSVRKIASIVGGCALLLFCALVLLGVLVGPGDPPPASTKPPESPTASATASGPRTTGPMPPKILRALPVQGPSASPSFRTDSPLVGPLYSVVGVPEGDTLNVRAGPGMKNPITARLPGGTAHVEITGTAVMNERTEWVPVKAGDQLGWVTKSHLRRE